MFPVRIGDYLATENIQALMGQTVLEEQRVALCCRTAHRTLIYGCVFD